MKGKLKKCPSCGKFFNCAGDEDCWCENYKIHNREFVTLMQNYTDCICQECLKQYERD